MRNPTITHNNIYGNTGLYELANGSAQGSPNLDAKNNWWGTTDSTEIADRIYDFFDNSARGIVLYSPYLSTPELDVPALPPLADAGGDHGAYIGEMVRLNGGNSFDPAGNPLTYRWSQTCGPSVTLDNPDTAFPSFTAPAVTVTTPFCFTLTVSNGVPPYDTAMDGVTVTILPYPAPPADAPVLDPIGDKSVNEGQLLTFTLSASDADGDPLTYSASNLPPGASFDPITHTFSWTPTSEQVGTYPQVRFQVSDGSLTDSEEITLTVNASSEAAYRHLDQVMDRYQTGDALRLLESYTATPTFTGQQNVAYLYDNALALLAFLARGTEEDLRRARLLAEAFLYLLEHDPLGDGRLRDAYAADRLSDEAGQPRLQSLASSTGNLAWAMVALLRYWGAQGGERYLQGAGQLAEWIVAHTFDRRGAGGFTGGVDGELNPIPWKSTEHNLDLQAAFGLLSRATGERRWREQAAHARGLVEAMWAGDEGHFWTGTLEDGVTINRAPVPLDVQGWAVLTLGGRYAGGLSWAGQNLRLEPCECGRFQGYKFSTEGAGCWFEGSAQLALALKLLGDGSGAEGLFNDLHDVQSQAPNADGQGIVAACSDGVETGYGWSYSNALHVGATAWYLLAQGGYNPLAELALGLNQTAFGRGEDLRLTALVTPGVPPWEVDVYLAVRLPESTGGTLLFLQEDGHLSLEARPILRRWTMAPFQGEVFRYTFGGGEPAGSYAWLAAFTEPGTLNLIGEIVQLPFLLHP